MVGGWNSSGLATGALSERPAPARDADDRLELLARVSTALPNRSQTPVSPAAPWPSRSRLPRLHGLTCSIRAGKGPFRNISLGSEHLHHCMRGIGLLVGVGAVAVRGAERHRCHPAVAVSHGSSLALTADEFALLLNLKNVYWAKRGRISTDVGGIALTRMSMPACAAGGDLTDLAAAGAAGGRVIRSRSQGPAAAA